jgi:hypothetical protein
MSEATGGALAQSALSTLRWPALKMPILKSLSYFVLFPRNSARCGLECGELSRGLSRSYLTAIRAQVSAWAVEGLRRMKPEEALPYAKAIQLGKHGGAREGASRPRNDHPVSLRKRLRKLKIKVTM